MNEGLRVDKDQVLMMDISPVDRSRGLTRPGPLLTPQLPHGIRRRSAQTAGGVRAATCSSAECA